MHACLLSISCLNACIRSSFMWNYSTRNFDRTTAVRLRNKNRRRESSFFFLSLFDVQVMSICDLSSICRSLSTFLFLFALTSSTFCILTLMSLTFFLSSLSVSGKRRFSFSSFLFICNN